MLTICCQKMITNRQKVSALSEKYFQVVDCPACGSDKSREYFSIKYGRLRQKASLDYGILGIGPDTEIKVDHCESCGLVFVNPRVRPEFESLVYNDAKVNMYSEKGAPVDGKSVIEKALLRQASSGRLLMEMVAYVDRGGPLRLFDYGCGEGHTLLAARDAGIDGYGIDIDKERIESCRSKGLKVFSPGEFVMKYGDLSFDLVTWQSNIEHLLDVRKVAELIRSKCRKDTILHVNGWTPGIIHREKQKGEFVKAHFIEHINYFPLKTLDGFFAGYNFLPLAMQKYTLVRKPVDLLSALGKIIMSAGMFEGLFADWYGKFSRFYRYTG